MPEQTKATSVYTDDYQAAIETIQSDSMTVGELLAKLKNLDPTAYVIRPSPNHDYCSTENAVPIRKVSDHSGMMMKNYARWTGVKLIDDDDAYSHDDYTADDLAEREAYQREASAAEFKVVILR